LAQVRQDKALASEHAERMRRAGDAVARQVADLQRKWTERQSRLGEEKRRQDAVAGRIATEGTPPGNPPPKSVQKTGGPSPESRSDAPTAGLAALRGKLPAPVGGRVSRPFGSRQDNALGTVLDNPGVDFRCEPGSPVSAVHTGRVEKITWVAGFGNTVLVSHGQGCWTVYAKLEEVDVREGQGVSTGQRLGRAGRFDSADQGAVHFELWQDRQARNPSQWLRP
jgi:septal ring factor EnvC (AmiA/AmiB activator)